MRRGSKDSERVINHTGGLQISGAGREREGGKWEGAPQLIASILFYVYQRVPASASKLSIGSSDKELTCHTI